MQLLVTEALLALNASSPFTITAQITGFYPALNYMSAIPVMVSRQRQESIGPT